MPMAKLPLTVGYGLLGFVRQQPLQGYAELERLAQVGYLTGGER